MTKVSKGNILIRGACLMIAVCVIIAVYALLGVARQSRVDMRDTAGKRFHWTYEAAFEDGSRFIEPVFTQDGYGMNAVGDDCRAVRISRVMDEDYGPSQVAFFTGCVGIEVSLDGEILYADFETSLRDSQGYLALDDGDFDGHLSEFRNLQFPLPSVYEGKTLCVTTYFPKTLAANRVPAYPVVIPEWAQDDGVAIDTVKPVATTTCFALFTIVLLAMFLLGGEGGMRILSYAFLALYFLMLFVSNSYNSLPGMFSRLSTYTALGIVEYLCPTFLYLAIASRLSGWRKWGLFGASVAQFLFTAFMMASVYLREGYMYCADNGLTSALLIAVTMALMIVERTQRKGPQSKGKWIRTVTVWFLVALIYTVYDAGRHEFAIGLYFENMLRSAWEYGNFLPFVTAVTQITAYSTAILLVWHSIDRSFEQQRERQALAERGRLTLMHYQNLLDYEENDRERRHEMKHHMSAIAALLDGGETERARAYIRKVAEQATGAQPVSLCRNLLVSAVVGRYLQAARDRGIDASAHILVPAEIRIADEDVCAYLTNLLENALEACEKCDGDQARYIRFTMEKQGNFIYIGCRNSASEKAQLNEDGLPGTTKGNSGSHGYGMIAMRRVAEKYNSVLLIQQTPGEFSVMTNLQDQ